MTRTDTYIIDDDGNIVPEPDIMKWGLWMHNADRHVAKDTVGDVKVSTVFIGMDHSFGHGLKILYETMILGGPHDCYQERYTSHEAAQAGHERAVARAKEGK